MFVTSVTKFIIDRTMHVNKHDHPRQMWVNAVYKVALKGTFDDVILSVYSVKITWMHT